MSAAIPLLAVVDIDKFCDGARLFRSGLGGLQHLVRVPARAPLCGSVAEAPSANPTPAPRAHLARAGVEEHREWLTVFHGNSFIH